MYYHGVLLIRIQYWNIFIPPVLGYDGHMRVIVNILLWKRVCQLPTACMLRQWETTQSSSPVLTVCIPDNYDHHLTLL